MSTASKLGIWMDHSDAHLITYAKEPQSIGVIHNPFKHTEMESALRKGEHLMHNKRQQKEAAYYKELEDKIIHYEDVILFGPTDAKSELFNLLQADHRFEMIKIKVLPADQMTDNQKQAFVKDYFSGSKQ